MTGIPNWDIHIRAYSNGGIVMDRPRTCAERHDEEIAVLAARVAELEAEQREIVERMTDQIETLQTILEPEDHTQQLIENRAWGLEWQRFRRRCEVLYQRRVMTGQWRWLIDSCNRGQGKNDADNA